MKMVCKVGSGIGATLAVPIGLGVAFAILCGLYLLSKKTVVGVILGYIIVFGGGGIVAIAIAIGIGAAWFAIQSYLYRHCENFWNKRATAPQKGDLDDRE